MLSRAGCVNSLSVGSLLKALFDKVFLSFQDIDVDDVLRSLREKRKLQEAAAQERLAAEAQARRQRAEQRRRESEHTHQLVPTTKSPLASHPHSPLASRLVSLQASRSGSPVTVAQDRDSSLPAFSGTACGWIPTCCLLGVHAACFSFQWLIRQRSTSFVMSLPADICH